MQTVLLDTNCLIDLAEDCQPRAANLRRIVAGQGSGYEVVASAITASENPKQGHAPKTWDEFVSLLERAGLPDARVLSPMAYWDVTFWDHALWVGEGMKELEIKVHRTLAPGFDMDDRTNEHKWRNIKCDVQVVWTAIWHRVDTLITSDRPILSKADKLRELGIEAQSPAAFAANP
jgi:hypothetical protein